MITALHGKAYRSKPTLVITRTRLKVPPAERLGGIPKRFEKHVKQRADHPERNKSPDLDVAYRMAGGEEFETLELIEQATDRIREALATVHHYTRSRKLSEVVEKFGIDALELLRKFPEVKERLLGKDQEVERKVGQLAKRKQ